MVGRPCLRSIRLELWTEGPCQKSKPVWDSQATSKSNARRGRFGWCTFTTTMTRWKSRTRPLFSARTITPSLLFPQELRAHWFGSVRPKLRQDALSVVQRSPFSVQDRRYHMEHGCIAFHPRWKAHYSAPLQICDKAPCSNLLIPTAQPDNRTEEIAQGITFLLLSLWMPLPILCPTLGMQRHLL